MTRRTTITLLAVLYSLPSPAGTVSLKQKFVDTYKDRATITAQMTIRHAHKQPNSVGSGADDGDLHFSGVSDDIGLPFVAEIVNARQSGEKAAIKVVHDNEKNGSVKVSGAWRLWFEHPAQKQVQGGNNSFSPDTTNPDHSFEIHPISQLNDKVDVTGAFVPVVNYTAYSATKAFPYFDSIALTAKASSSGITLETPKAKFNYVEFWIELTQEPKRVSDGYIALAAVQDRDGTEVSEGERRMIFVDGTPAAKVVSKLSTSDRLHVMGIPRINLNALEFLAQEHGKAQFKAKLPYEMIIVGVFAK